MILRATIIVISFLVLGCNSANDDLSAESVLESANIQVIERHPSGEKKLVYIYTDKGTESESLERFYYLPDGTEFNSISYNDNDEITAVHQMDKIKKIPVGRSLRFDKKHNIISDSNYKDGKLDGEWVIYTPDGRIMSRTFWEDGNKIKR